MNQKGLSALAVGLFLSFGAGAQEKNAQGAPDPFDVALQAISEAFPNLSIQFEVPDAPTQREKLAVIRAARAMTEIRTTHLTRQENQEGLHVRDRRPLNEELPPPRCEVTATGDFSPWGLMALLETLDVVVVRERACNLVISDPCKPFVKGDLSPTARRLVSETLVLLQQRDCRVAIELNRVEMSGEIQLTER